MFSLIVHCIGIQNIEVLTSLGSLQFSHVGRSAVSPLTLTCDTTGLPATLVRWTKDSFTLSDGPVYQLRQTYVSNFLADFTNELVINRPIHEVQGIYSCRVINGLHEPIQDRPEVSIGRFVFMTIAQVISLLHNVR